MEIQITEEALIKLGFEKEESDDMDEGFCWTHK